MIVFLYLPAIIFGILAFVSYKDSKQPKKHFKRKISETIL